MTWGQLRLQLQIGSEISLDLLDEFLNGRYEQVLEANDWKGCRYHATIQTTAAYQSATDTATLTVGSNAVTGVSTTWTSALIGKRFYRPGDAALYAVAAVGGTTSLTLDRPYEGISGNASGTVYSGSSYVLMQNVYTLPGDVRSVISILDPVTNAPMERMSKDGLDTSAGARTLIGDPKVWVLYDDTDETAPPVIHQIELFPPPMYARGYQVQYLHTAIGFDGTNTSGGPQPWVGTQVLLYGCRADIAAHMAGQSEGAASVYFAQAKMYEAKFQEELARILRKEHNERAKVPMQMAGRFTRHRFDRATRGGRTGWGVGQGGPS